MKSNLLFDFIVDKGAKTVTVKREFAAELPLVWDAYTKQELNGGCRNRGNQEQSLWTLEWVDEDFMQ